MSVIRDALLAALKAVEDAEDPDALYDAHEALYAAAKELVEAEADENCACGPNGPCVYHDLNG
jgi:hypothetical protein